MLPAYCRVALILKPSTDSTIEMELWMPAQNWNNKFEMVGNGGWAGSIQGFAQMQRAIREGYATAGTDTGHKGADPAFSRWDIRRSWLISRIARCMRRWSNPRPISRRIYGKDPKFSYWNGCSTGGRQGLMEAQKYPNDFDAIIAGAPADYQTHLHAWDMMVAAAVRKDDQHFVSAPKLAALNKAVMEACDASDGVKDGLLNDPRKCNFDPGKLSCKAGENKDDCLTPAELESVKLVLSPAKKNNGELIFPGKEPGGETGWNMISQRSAAPQAISSGTFQYATYPGRQLGLAQVRSGQRHRGGGREVRLHQRDVRPDGVQKSRRKAADVSRLERSADFAGEHHQPVHQHRAEDRIESGLLGASCT